MKAQEELASETGSRLGQSTVLWCPHVPLQGQSLGLPLPGPHRKGYTDVQRCLETAARIREKLELSVTLTASFGKTVIWNQTKWGVFLPIFRRKVTLSIS